MSHMKVECEFQAQCKYTMLLMYYIKLIRKKQGPFEGELPENLMFGIPFRCLQLNYNTCMPHFIVFIFIYLFFDTYFFLFSLNPRQLT